MSKTYLGSYGLDGKQYGFEIEADSFDDARRRLDAIKAWGKIDGELMAKIPAYPGAGLFVRFLCWWRNK